MVSNRRVDITSDDGTYRIIGVMRSLQNCYNMSESSFKNYGGSYWTVKIYKKGKPVDSVIYNGYERMHYGEYCCGMCQHVKLNKNTILYGAIVCGLFSKEIAQNNIDVKKVEKTWMKEYVDGMIKDKVKSEAANLNISAEEYLQLCKDMYNDK